MKQPDTAALRERLANYTPEDKLKENKQKLDGLLQEVNCQITELRNLMKESKHSKKCTFYTLRFGCSFAAVNTIKPQLL